MDGYSVHDAAAVLGIPETRVWELIARGVLSGTPEGDGGMRVFLKQVAQAPAREVPRPNGNGGAHDVELSPFRELLTEFRNLTERYGQALLALGESRGEVAALRSRVDLLEARIDLRLPGTRPASTVAWEVPGQEAPMEVTDQVPPPEERQAAPDEPTRPTSRRRRGPRTTPAAFAEALARAQDPTLPELPGAREAAEALASLRELPAAEGLAEVAAEPPVEEFREPEVAEAPRIDAPSPEEAVTDEVAPTAALDALDEEPAGDRAEPPSIYSTELVEPDWFADGDFSWLEQAAAAAAESPAPRSEPAESELAPEVDVVMQGEPPTGADRNDDAAIASPIAAAETPPDDESSTPEPIGEATAAVPEAEAVAATVDAIDVPIRAAAEPEPEPGLWVADTEPGAEWASLPPVRAPHSAPEARPRSESALTEPEIEPGASAANLGGDEVPLMWLGDEFGAAELEFAAPGWGGPSPDLPAEPMEWVAPRDEPTPSAAAPDPAPAPEDPAPSEPSIAIPPRPRPPAPGDADWLRGRRGPAATAYRRLRRLFPG
jgi:hypothetical protein